MSISGIAIYCNLQIFDKRVIYQSAVIFITHTLNQMTAILRVIIQRAEAEAILWTLPFISLFLFI